MWCSPRVARRTVVLLALAAALMLVAISPSAQAVTGGIPTTTLSNYYTSIPGVTYTFGGYTVDNGEMVTGAVITFPAGTDVSAASLLAPPGTLAVNGQAVTLTFTPPIPKDTSVTISIGGITNPATPGAVSVGDAANPGTISFATSNPVNSNQVRNPQYLPSAAYTILPPYLTLTLTTPDAGQMVDFGQIDPGVATAAKSVTVAVDSSHPYSITRGRDLAAEAPIGLEITGTAEGTGLPAGQTTYMDQYRATPPWTTDPEIPLSATVTYTVVQQ